MNPFLDLRNIQSFKQKPATFGLGWCVFIFDSLSGLDLMFLICSYFAIYQIKSRFWFIEFSLQYNELGNCNDIKLGSFECLTLHIFFLCLFSSDTTINQWALVLHIVAKKAALFHAEAILSEARFINGTSCLVAENQPKTCSKSALILMANFEPGCSWEKGGVLMVLSYISNKFLGGLFCKFLIN